MFLPGVWQSISFYPAQLQVDGLTYATQPLWTQLLTALIIGLLTAFALQFLLTSLGIAVGLSVMQWRSSQTTPSEQLDSSEADAIEVNASDLDAAKTAPQSSFATVGGLAGTGILLTLNLVLFASCFLATKAIQVGSPLSGSITGIVIWSAYFLLLLWFSSNAVSSLVGTLFDTATGGLRRLLSLITAIGQNQEDPEPATEAEIMAAVRQEMQTMLNQVDWQALATEKTQPLLTTVHQEGSATSTLEADEDIAVESTPSSTSLSQPAAIEWQQQLMQKLAVYLQDSSPKKLTAKRMQHKFEKLLHKASAKLPENALLPALLPNLTCAEVQSLLSQRPDLSEKQKQQIGQQAEQLWQQAIQDYYQRSEPAGSSEAVEEVEAESTQPTKLIPQLTSALLPIELPFDEESSIEQAMATLTEKLQQLEQVLPWSEIAPKLMPLVLPRIYQSLKANNVDLTNYSALEPGQLLKQLQPGLTGLNRSVLQQLETVLDQLLQQADSVQQTVKSRITSLKQQTQHQLAATRQAAAIAAWWLFAIAFTSLISSALAGALATSNLDISHFLPQL